VKWAAAIVLIAACGGHDDATPAPAPAPVRLDAPVHAPPARLAPGSWRLPILSITKDTVELRWRRPDAPDEPGVTQPLASWTCPPLHGALVDEAKRTWGRTPVRPPDSETLLVSVGGGVPDATVFAITNCVNDPSDPRPPYRDLMITPDPSP